MKTIIAAFFVPAFALAGLAQPPVAGEPSRAEVVAAMTRATSFMVDTVSTHGGYVWVVSEDLTQRWGEVPARPSQIWVQAGTPTVGNAFLDAYAATGEACFLEAARKAADALIFGQHPLGGWHYFIDFDPKGLPHWYRTRASRFLFGYEEYRHYYGNATYDDGVTPAAAEFLLRYYRTTLDPAYRAPVLKALEFVLVSQYPNGAWPQRYPLRYEFAHDGLPDYTSYYTLNDGAMFATLELLVQAHHTLSDGRYFDAACRGADFLIAVQGPAGQEAWAEQYGMDLRPAAARTHEPAGYVLRESRGAVRMLEMFYVLTGDARYLKPIPGCFAWFERVARESKDRKLPIARYYEPGTNDPVYSIGTEARTPEGYGVNEWSKTPRPGTTDRETINVLPLRREFDTVAALTTPEARAAYFSRHFAASGQRAPDAATVRSMLASQDRRGAWVTDGNMVHAILPEGEMNPGTRVPVRGLSTSVFVRNLRQLAAFVANQTPRTGKDHP